MVAWSTAIFGERSVTKLAGLYASEAQAQRAARTLSEQADLDPGQVRVLGPADASRQRREFFSRSVEPETRGIFQTMIRAHIVLGLAGAAAGVLLYAIWRWQGVALVVSSPWLSLLAVLGFATTFGLMAGGLVSLRPDHALLIQRLRRALRAGRWAVVIHPVDDGQVAAARRTFSDTGADVMATL